MGFVISMNLKRRHLTATQRATLSVEILPTLEKEAKQRMVAGGGDQKSGKHKVGLPDPNIGQARDKAAKLMGVSKNYVSKAKAIKEEHPPKRVQPVNSDARRKPR